MPLAEARESVHARSVTRRGVQGRGELGARPLSGDSNFRMDRPRRLTDRFEGAMPATDPGRTATSMSD